MRHLIPIALLAACGNKPAPEPVPEPAPADCSALSLEDCWASDACVLDGALVCRAPADACEEALLAGGKDACEAAHCVYQAFPCFCPPGLTCVCGGGAPPRCLAEPPRDVQRTWACHGDEVCAGFAGPDLDVVAVGSAGWQWVVPSTGTGATGAVTEPWPEVDPAEPVEALVEAERAFAADSAARGAEAWRAVFSPDGVAWGPEGFTVGADAVAERMAGAFDAGLTLTWEATGAALAPSGDLGITIGPFEAGSEDAVQTGTYITVWRKRADGTWGVALDFPYTPHGGGG